MIKFLNLKDNSLDYAAGQCFTEALSINETITSLNLVRNPMPYKFVVEIQKAITKNRSKIKRDRKPNCVKKVKELTAFKA